MALIKVSSILIFSLPVEQPASYRWVVNTETNTEEITGWSWWWGAGAVTYAVIPQRCCFMHLTKVGSVEQRLDIQFSIVGSSSEQMNSPNLIIFYPFLNFKYLLSHTVLISIDQVHSRLNLTTDPEANWPQEPLWPNPTSRNPLYIKLPTVTAFTLWKKSSLTFWGILFFSPE